MNANKQLSSEYIDSLITLARKKIFFDGVEFDYDEWMDHTNDNEETAYYFAIHYGNVIQAREVLDNLGIVWKRSTDIIQEYTDLISENGDIKKYLVQFSEELKDRYNTKLQDILLYEMGSSFTEKVLEEMNQS